MKITTKTIKEFRVEYSVYWLEATFDDKWICIDFNSNTAHLKSSEEWKFVAKAMLRIVKELKAHSS